jgi:hypothetical protein
LRGGYTAMGVGGLGSVFAIALNIALLVHENRRSNSHTPTAAARS